MKTTQELMDTGVELKNAGNKCFVEGDVKGALINYHQALLYLNGLNVSTTGFLPAGLSTGVTKEQPPTPEMRHLIVETLAACHLNMAACYLKQLKWQRCIEVSGKALKLYEELANNAEVEQTKPINPLSTAMSNQSLSQQQHKSQAIVEVDSTHPLAAKIAKSLYRRAHAKFEGGMDIDSAEEDTIKAFKLAPQDSEIRRLLQAIQSRQRELKEKADAQFRGFLNKSSKNYH